MLARIIKRQSEAEIKAMVFQQIINVIILNPKKLFLADSLGALLSAFLLGVVLASFEGTFGMPRKILYCLSSAACVFAIYSFLCYWRIEENWRPYLRVIAIANLMYCCITIGLVISFRQELTHWGLTYFLLEIVVILILVFAELKIFMVRTIMIWFFLHLTFFA